MITCIEPMRDRRLCEAFATCMALLFYVNSLCHTVIDDMLLRDKHINKEWYKLTQSQRKKNCETEKSEDRLKNRKKTTQGMLTIDLLKTPSSTVQYHGGEYLFLRCPTVKKFNVKFCL